MSWRTKCNYCVLKQIKENNPGKEVTVVKAGEYEYVDLQVYVDGQPIGVWFAAIGDHCEC